MNESVEEVDKRIQEGEMVELDVAAETIAEDSDCDKSAVKCSLLLKYDFMQKSDGTTVIRQVKKS